MWGLQKLVLGRLLRTRRGPFAFWPQMREVGGPLEIVGESCFDQRTKGFQANRLHPATGEGYS